MSKYDKIMNMLDWNKEEKIQKEGIELAKEMEDLTIFFQPLGEETGKKVWENCAIIISERSDEELEKYLDKMLEWLQDFNWPGALIILDRLKRFNYKILIGKLNECINKAIESSDYNWLSNLTELINDELKRKEIEKMCDEYFNKCYEKEKQQILNKKEELISQLDDDNFRLYALIALSKLKDKTLSKYFKIYANDSDEFIQLVSRQALIAIDSEK